MAHLTQWLRALMPVREQLEANPWLRSMVPYLTDPKLWQWSRRGVATGSAVGLFIGLLIPVAQIPLAAAAAVTIRANVAVAALGTLLTNPLTVPPIYYAAYHLGSWVTGTSLPATVSLADPMVLWDNLGTIGMPLFVGLAIMATCVSLTSYLIISRVWIWRVASKRQEGRR